MNGLNGLGEQRGYRELLDPTRRQRGFPKGDGVREHHLFEIRISNALNRRPRQNGVGSAGADTFGSAVEERFGPFHEGAGGIDDIVHEQASLAADVADDMHDLGDIDVFPALVDDGQRRV